MQDARRIQDAWERLRDVTPLAQDCGHHCQGACCQDDEGQGLGMLLFPHEEKLYGAQDAAWAEVCLSQAMREGENMPMLVCAGTCPRPMRPLACRIFPLGPWVRKGSVTLRIDPRSRRMCPLADSGVQGLLPAFRQSVQAVFDALWEDEQQRAYLTWLSDLLDDEIRLMRRFGV